MSDKTPDTIDHGTMDHDAPQTEAGEATARKARKEPVFGLKLIRRRVSRIQGMQQRRKAVRSRDALLREVLARIAEGSATNPKAWAAAVLGVYDLPAATDAVAPEVETELS